MKRGNLTKKEFLEQAFYLNNEIKAKKEEIEKLESMVVYVSPQIRELNTPSFENNKEKMMCVIADYKDELVRDITKLVYLKHQIIVAINKIEDSMIRTLLTLRFIEFKTWEVIAEEMHYGDRHMMRLSKKAIDMIEVELE